MLSLDWIAGFFDGEGSIGIYAIQWQRDRPKVQRDARGRVTALTSEAISYNRAAVGRIAAMKK